VNVNVTVARCEDAAMFGRVKTDDGRYSVLQLEGDLNLLMHFHVVWSVADAIHNMELDEALASAYEEGQRLICIETGRGSGLRNEALKFLEGANVRWNRDLLPQRNLGPHEERYTRLEALGHLDGVVRCDSRKRRSAIRNRHLSPKLLDRTDAVEMLSARQGPQI